VLKVGAMDPIEVLALQELLKRGSTTACCGRWRVQAAAQFQRRVALNLRVSERRLSDVHMANSSMWAQADVLSGNWGPMAVLYLDESPNTTVSFMSENGQHMVADAPRGTILVVPDGGQVVHEAARSVAWLRVRREGTPDRSKFEFFVASGIRSSFVAPHDTAQQRKIFRSHTRSSTYWHGFFWAFLGLFCTMLAFLPLAWWAMQFMDNADATMAQCKRTSLARPWSGEQLPTLLPLFNSGNGRQAMKCSKHQYFGAAGKAIFPNQAGS